MEIRLPDKDTGQSKRFGDSGLNRRTVGPAELGQSKATAVRVI